MSTAPRVSIGLPVRNGAQYISRAIESVLAQDYSNLELVICDNDSDDATCEIVRSYAARDARVKLHENGRDLGQIANMNRVFELAAGEYLRWTGVDDWFEPDYVSKCVEFLDHEPRFLGVSTYIKYFGDDGNEYYAEYTGERFDSPRPHRRFSRLLWFSQADYRYCDPHYTMYRRSALQMTHLCQVAYATDLILAAEVSLLGPTGHIPECLAYRRREPSDYAQVEAVEKRYHPGQPEELRRSVIQICSKFDEIVRAAPLPAFQRAACRGAIGRYFLQEQRRVQGGKMRDVARRLPGYQTVKATLGR